MYTTISMGLNHRGSFSIGCMTGQHTHKMFYPNLTAVVREKSGCVLFRENIFLFSVKL